MSGHPPGQPQVSADGKFYWDGARWVPMQQSAPPAVEVQKSHRVRNGCLGLIVLAILIAFIASRGSTSQSALTLKWTVEGRSIKTSTVGGTDAVQVTVTNNGPAASNLILYLNAKDNWFKHHVITDPGGCTINKNLERLDCGAFAAGETKTINVDGSPKDAGNFDFELDVGDAEGSQLLYPPQGSLTWSETVTA